jgi:molecular chaperone IbpA
MRNNQSTSLLPYFDELFRDLNRYAIGFEPMITRLHSLNPGQNSGYPPYNLEHDGSIYRLELAVAGFKMQELEVCVTNDRLLIIRGSKAEDQTARQWIHRGIAGRNFEREFNLAEYITVVDAKLEHGMLTIVLQNEIPDASKMRVIPITDGNVIDVTGKVNV